MITFLKEEEDYDHGCSVTVLTKYPIFEFL